MPKLNFLIDPDKEYEYHRLFLSHRGLARLSLFNHSSIEDKERIIRKINSFWDNQDREVINEIEKHWQTIETQYFNLVEKITGVPWVYQNYSAFFLAFSLVAGFSNPFNLKSSEIVLTTGAAINPKFIVAHELFHSHYYYVVDKLGLTEKANKTLFTEGIAGLALFKTEMRELFPDTDTEKSISSYSEVRQNWEKLETLWGERTSFKDFLIEAVKIEDQ